MFERILVALDGATPTEIVLPYSEELAAKFGAEIMLISILEPTAEDRDHLYRSYLEHIAQQVEGELEDWGAEKGPRVRCEVLLGRPAEEMLRFADEKDVSLIIMASGGRSPRGPWFLGNVAAKVLRATNKAVLLVRKAASESAVQQRRLVRRILVPLDGSQEGEAAIPYVEALARASPAELVLLQVLRPIAPTAAEGIAMSPALYAEEEERERAAALSYLDSMGKKFQDKGLSTSKALGSGPPANQIIDYAEENAIDLIAMSTHGRSGIGRWVFGSVTDKVLHAGDTPVLTVRAAKA